MENTSAFCLCDIIIIITTTIIIIIIIVIIIIIIVQKYKWSAYSRIKIKK